MRSLGRECATQDTCSHSQQMLCLADASVCACVSWDAHGCSVLSFSCRQKTCQWLFLLHIAHRDRADATVPAFCEPSSLSLMEMHARIFARLLWLLTSQQKRKVRTVESGAAWKSPDGCVCWVAAPGDCCTSCLCFPPHLPFPLGRSVLGCLR